MAKNKIPHEVWAEFIKVLSTIMDREEARDYNYKTFLESHGKNMPDFKEAFIEKAKALSYPEREEYYKACNIDSETRQFFEDFTIEYAEGTYDLYGMLRYNDLFGKMFKWFAAENKSFALTRVWLFSTGRKESNIEIPYVEKLMILCMLIQNNVLTGDPGDLQYEGEPLSKVLSVVMNAPAPSIEDSFRKIKDFAEFEKLNRLRTGGIVRRKDVEGKTVLLQRNPKNGAEATAVKYKNRNELIESVFERVKFHPGMEAKKKKSSKLFHNWQGIKDQLDNLKKGYYSYFGESNEKE